MNAQWGTVQPVAEISAAVINSPFQASLRSEWVDHSPELSPQEDGVARTAGSTPLALLSTRSALFSLNTAGFGEASDDTTWATPSFGSA